MRPGSYAAPGDTEETIEFIEGHNLRGKRAKCPGFK